MEIRHTVEESLRNVRKLINMVPMGGKCIFVFDHDKQRAPDGQVVHIHWVETYRNAVMEIVSHVPYAGVVSMSNAVYVDNDMATVNHYARPVYLRTALLIVDLIKELPARQ